VRRSGLKRIRKEISKFLVYISESKNITLFPMNKVYPSFSFIKAAIGQCR